MLRKVKKGDFEKLVILEKDFLKSETKFRPYKNLKFKFSIHNFKRDFEEKFNKNSYYYLIEDKERIIGFIYGFIEKLPNDCTLRKMGHLVSLYVSPKYRSKGYSIKLVNPFFSWLKNNKIKYCRLEVKAMNYKMISIIKKIGFKEYKINFIKKL